MAPRFPRQERTEELPLDWTTRLMGAMERSAEQKSLQEIQVGKPWLSYRRLNARPSDLAN